MCLSGRLALVQHLTDYKPAVWFSAAIALKMWPCLVFSRTSLSHSLPSLICSVCQSFVAGKVPEVASGNDKRNIYPRIQRMNRCLDQAVILPGDSPLDWGSSRLLHLRRWRHHRFHSHWNPSRRVEAFCLKCKRDVARTNLRLVLNIVFVAFGFMTFSTALVMHELLESGYLRIYSTDMCDNHKPSVFFGYWVPSSHKISTFQKNFSL